MDCGVFNEALVEEVSRNRFDIANKTNGSKNRGNEASTSQYSPEELEFGHIIVTGGFLEIFLRVKYQLVSLIVQPYKNHRELDAVLQCIENSAVFLLFHMHPQHIYLDTPQQLVEYFRNRFITFFEKLNYGRYSYVIIKPFQPSDFRVKK
ncbi:unnamed protein product [Acanthoscelides obtectus]|uniref:Uncharacterized protein n=1 Tax=Acanthoscelides obtectus TaxID=200917 RepID=A0A9P0PLY8_ACAOB|nr:unnamed protein product [Acanthoscelides obtectus]CAK1635941.1 hypothetical protein AOBTE_LOCUS9643 [Acanthoscelides obtectus]